MNWHFLVRTRMKVTSLPGSTSLNIVTAWLTRLPRMLLYWLVVLGSRVDFIQAPSWCQLFNTYGMVFHIYLVDNNCSDDPLVSHESFQGLFHLSSHFLLIRQIQCYHTCQLGHQNTEWFCSDLSRPAEWPGLQWPGSVPAFRSAGESTHSPNLLQLVLPWLYWRFD